VPHIPSAPSPLEAAPREDSESSGSAAPWILLGVLLIGALVGALAWALHG
jgi:hypothetical protein